MAVDIDCVQTRGDSLWAGVGQYGRFVVQVFTVEGNGVVHLDLAKAIRLRNELDRFIQSSTRVS